MSDIIRYTVDSNTFPVYVNLYEYSDPDNAIATNVHWANEEGFFNADETYYYVTFNNECVDDTELIWCTTTTTTVAPDALVVIIEYYERAWYSDFLDGLKGSFSIDQPGGITITRVLFPFTKYTSYYYSDGAGVYGTDFSGITHFISAVQSSPVYFRYSINSGEWVYGQPSSVNVVSGINSIHVQVSATDWNATTTTSTTSEPTTTTTSTTVEPTTTTTYNSIPP